MFIQEFSNLSDKIVGISLEIPSGAQYKSSAKNCTCDLFFFYVWTVFRIPPGVLQKFYIFQCSYNFINTLSIIIIIIIIENVIFNFYKNVQTWQFKTFCAGVIAQQQAFIGRKKMLLEGKNLPRILLKTNLFLVILSRILQESFSFVIMLSKILPEPFLGLST